MAFYNESRDAIYVLVVKRFETTFVNGTIHEFGHRYWNRFLPQPVKAEWSRWHRKLEDDATQAFKYRTPSVGDTIDGKRIAEITKRPGKGTILVFEGEASYITLDNYWNVERRNAILREYPTIYSATNGEEHFCEAFALFCMGEIAEPHRAEFVRIFDIAQAPAPAPAPAPLPGPKGQMAMFNPSRRASALHRRITGS
jgi:hypothetical protein